jgi:predicted PurR-regulated permease PerM
VLAYLVFLIVRPFVTPLVFAVVMVVVFWPLLRRLERRLPPSAAATVSTLAVVLVIIVPAVLIVGRIVNETIDLAGNVRTLPFDALLARAQGHAARWGLDLEQVLLDGAQQLAGQAGLLVSRVIRNTWALFIGVIIAMLAMFFLFRDGTQLLRVVIRAIPLSAAVTNSWVDHRPPSSGAWSWGSFACFP